MVGPDGPDVHGRGTRLRAGCRRHRQRAVAAGVPGSDRRGRRQRARQRRALLHGPPRRGLGRRRAARGSGRHRRRELPPVPPLTDLSIAADAVARQRAHRAQRSAQRRVLAHGGRCRLPLAGRRRSALPAWRRCTPPRRGRLLPHVASAARGIVPLTTFALRRLTHRPARRRALSLRIVTEQFPTATLASAWRAPRRDRHFRASTSTGASRRAISTSSAPTRTSSRACSRTSGVARIDDRFDVRTQCAPVMPMYHHIGTTRMHRDPRHGVVDADLRVHSTSNLYVAGSSVFPTGGYVNPTLTIIALAHRLADRVSQSLGVVPSRRLSLATSDRHPLPIRILPLPWSSLSSSAPSGVISGSFCSARSSVPSRA